MLTIIVEQRFLRLHSVSYAKDRIRFNFRAPRAVFQRNKATFKAIFHMAPFASGIFNKEFGIFTSWKYYCFWTDRFSNNKMRAAKDDNRTSSIISWCVLEPYWCGKSEYESLALGKVSSVWAPDISCLTPTHRYFKTLTLISIYCQQYCKNNSTEKK